MTPAITEAMIRQRVYGDTFARGRDYQRQGAVLSLVRRDDVLQGEVEGSAPTPYRVRVTFDAVGVAEAKCDCPYEGVGWCKHIVAALLAANADPDRVEQRPALATLLADLDRDQLQGLLLGLVERDPYLTDALAARIDALNAALTGAAPAPPPARQPRAIPVDPGVIRRRVQAALYGVNRMRSSDAYWAVGGVIGEIRRLVDQVDAFTESDDGDTALNLLDAITEEYIAGWEQLDGSSGETGDFFRELGPSWTEALLSVDLSALERRNWTKKLTAWEREIADYGIDYAFQAARVAAEYGWETPDELAFDEEPEYDEDDYYEVEEYLDPAAAPKAEITNAKLNILARRGQTDEFLRLALAEGEIARYVTMLVTLGRAEEAVAYGLRQLTTPAEALTLSTALREQNELDRALQIALHGLDLEGHLTQLAVWTRDLAAALDRPAEAIRAARVAFRAEPGLTNYLRAQELAGDEWPDHRADLLAWLRRSHTYHIQGKIDVFLHESLIDDAIATADAHPHYGYVEPVADAALATHPDWVIGATRRQAESIMDGGQSGHYDAAARWLAKTRAAYQVANREAEWQAYHAELLVKHKRKYKLVPMIQAIG